MWLHENGAFQKHCRHDVALYIQYNKEIHRVRFNWKLNAAESIWQLISKV